MLREYRESRPEWENPEPATISTAIKTETSLNPLDDIARHVDGTFVVVVKVTGGRYRRRCFLTAASAQRAADRAIQRGETATVYLAELKPLWKLAGGAS